MAEYKPGLTAGPNAVPSTLSGEPWPRNFRQRQGQLRSLEASHVKGHQDANVKNPQDEAMGMTKGGRNTKIHAVVDALGHAVELDLTPGQSHDSTHAAKMTADIEPGKTVLADSASLHSRGPYQWRSGSSTQWAPP